MPLHAERIGRAALVDGPAQDVEHGAVDSIRKPSTPCWIGARPVVIDVSADAVVDGAMVVIRRPSARPARGSAARCASSSSQPRPSRTSRTTVVASRAGSGSPERSVRPVSAGTMRSTDAPP